MAHDGLDESSDVLAEDQSRVRLAEGRSAVTSAASSNAWDAAPADRPSHQTRLVHAASLQERAYLATAAGDTGVCGPEANEARATESGE